MIKEVNGVDDIQTQIISLKMNSLVGQNFTKTSSKETVVIDSEDNLQEILSTSVNIINKDTKISYNKVLAKADAEVKILYLTDDRQNKKSRRDNSNNGIYRLSRSFR